jgi:hypothetical protein
LLGAGFVSAIAFVVRPQFLLTWVIETCGRVFSLVRRRGVGRATRVLLYLALPMAIAATASSLRLRLLSGRWGIISENAEMNRIWADTDICKLTATWRTPTGDVWSYWFNPPSKPPRDERDEVHFDGYIADPDLLRAIRESRLRGVPWTARIARKFSNIDLLFERNLPWPESNYKDPWRLALQQWFAAALRVVVLPLCAVGLVLGRRNRAMLVLAANLATPIVAAAIYFGEARYHVPYDPFALLLAVVGLYELGRRTAGLARRMRLRYARATNRSIRSTALSSTPMGGPKENRTYALNREARP